jgi:hypothetical protein
MSPRKLTAETTFTDLESEVMFTIAGLGADPDARPLVGETADWLGWIDAAQKEDRAFRQQEANVEAGRVVANGRLDLTCITFGRRLLGACEQDRDSPRFKRFFAKPPLAFVKQALAKQVTAVFGWLSVNDDDVLEAHRLDLQERATNARAAQDATSALAPSAAQTKPGAPSSPTTSRVSATAFIGSSPKSPTKRTSAEPGRTSSSRRRVAMMRRRSFPLRRCRPEESFVNVRDVSWIIRRIHHSASCLRRAHATSQAINAPRHRDAHHFDTSYKTRGQTTSASN